MDIMKNEVKDVKDIKLGFDIQQAVEQELQINNLENTLDKLQAFIEINKRDVKEVVNNVQVQAINQTLAMSGLDCNLKKLKDVKVYKRVYILKLIIKNFKSMDWLAT